MSRRGVYYGRSDRKVLLLAVVFACVMICLAVFLGRETPAELGGKIGNDDSVSFASKHEKRPFYREKQIYYSVPEDKPELFLFDPNTADSTALLRLGLRPWQVRSIYKFRAKGGIYRKPSDFARLYGLTVGQYKTLEPYIRISEDFLPASTLIKEKRESRDTLRFPVKIGESEHIVLNTADTLQLRRVPGIGRGFARAIIRYGEWLGGYVSVDQLDEIEDFPVEAKKYFIISNPSPCKLNLNKCPAKEMRRHPYISYSQARAIEDYRRLHGKIHSLDDLMLHPYFTDDVRRRLAPYVEF